DATLTHPHPVCGLASVVFVLAIARAVATGDPATVISDFMLEQARTLNPDVIAIPPGPPCSPAVWEQARTGVAGALAAARQEPPVMKSHQMGWVLVALGNAAYELRHA